MTVPSLEEIVAQCHERVDFQNELLRILRMHNTRDKYWQDIYTYARNDEVFETVVLINWIGSHRRPKRVLEIGTRTGGSLVALLSAYPDEEVAKTEIYCFDIWKEFIRVCRFRGIVRHFPEFVKRDLAIGVVKNNLKLLGISPDTIKFFSGDSKTTVPQFIASDPRKFDYVLVDGSHHRDDARADLDNVVHAVAPNGILVFDDIGPEGYKLIDVWREFENKYRDLFHFYVKEHRKGVAWAIRKA